MAKQNRAARPAHPTTRPEPRPEALSLPPFFENLRLQSMVIFGFACLLYANTLFHEFVMDDAIVITDNMFTSKGLAGIHGILTEDTFFGFFKERGKEALVSGGRYRPLTLVVFAALWQVTHGPFAFHLLTVVLFASCCVVLLRVLRQLLEGQGVVMENVVPFGAALLFAAHPIHTEVVANVKGCDEIVTLLLSLAALFLAVKSARAGTQTGNLAAAAVLFLAMFSKENAITFLGIIPLALGLFTNIGWAKTAQRTLPFLAAFAVFMLIRTSILGWHFGAEPMELMNNPFLKLENGIWVKFSPAERFSTIVFTLGKYVQLLFFPITLTHDYYPRHIGIMNFGDAGVLASFALYAVLGWLAVANFQKNRVVSFSILFFFLSLSIVSNIVFPVGTNMGERFAFMPSVGFCFVASWLVFSFFKKSPGLTVPMGIIGAAAVLFSLKTITRNPVWQSNDRIFLTDIKTSANSAKLCNAAGGTLVDAAFKEKDETKRQAMLAEAAVHLNNAIKIHPTYKNAFLLLGNCYNYSKQYDKSAAYYREALRIDPDYKEARGNLAVTLREGGKQAGETAHDPQKALKLLTEAYAIDPKDIETIRLLGVANGILGNHAQAVEFFQKTVDADPKNARYLFDLGTAWTYAGDPAKGKAMQQKAMEMDPAAFKK